MAVRCAGWSSPSTSSVPANVSVAGERVHSPSTDFFGCSLVFASQAFPQVRLEVEHRNAERSVSFVVRPPERWALSYDPSASTTPPAAVYDGNEPTTSPHWTLPNDV